MSVAVHGSMLGLRHTHQSSLLVKWLIRELRTPFSRKVCPSRLYEQMINVVRRCKTCYQCVWRTLIGKKITVLTNYCQAYVFESMLTHS